MYTSTPYPHVCWQRQSRKGKRARAGDLKTKRKRKGEKREREIA